MTHGSVFSGIGGFDLAAEYMGWENVFHCEWEEFPQQILKYYWPKAQSYGDITKTDFTIHRGRIDVLTGGFPCQPYSTAGKRRGKDDERHLWPEMLRAIREIAPRWVVGENVRGLINWNGGLVFDEVQADLEAEGYEVQPFLLPAAGVNAPHRRDRIWFVAFNPECTTDVGGNPGKGKANGVEMEWNLLDPARWQQSSDYAEPSGEHGTVTDTPGIRCDWNDVKGKTLQRKEQTRGKAGASDNTQGVDTDTTNTRAESVQQRRENRINGFEDSSNTNGIILERHGKDSSKSRNNKGKTIIPTWDRFPTKSPIRVRNDGISTMLVRYITKELRHEISKTSQENRIKNMRKVRERIQQEEIWKKIRGLYAMEEKEISLQTMQLYAAEGKEQRELSPFSKKVSEKPLRILWKYGEFRRTPQGQELEKQRAREYSDALSFLPHEVALAAKSFEASVTKFKAWHRNESIKAGGNAVVPQVVMQIFKAIEQYENIK